MGLLCYLPNLLSQVDNSPFSESGPTVGVPSPSVPWFGPVTSVQYSVFVFLSLLKVWLPQIDPPLCPHYLLSDLVDWWGTPVGGCKVEKERARGMVPFANVTSNKCSFYQFVGTLFLFLQERVLMGFLLLLIYACHAKSCFMLYSPIYPSEGRLTSKIFTQTLVINVLCGCPEWYNSTLEGETAGTSWQGGSFNRKRLVVAFQSCCSLYGKLDISLLITGPEWLHLFQRNLMINPHHLESIFHIPVQFVLYFRM